MSNTEINTSRCKDLKNGIRANQKYIAETGRKLGELFVEKKALEVEISSVGDKILSIHKRQKTLMISSPFLGALSGAAAGAEVERLQIELTQLEIRKANLEAKHKRILYQIEKKKRDDDYYNENLRSLSSEANRIGCSM